MIIKCLEKLKKKYIYEVPYALDGPGWKAWRKEIKSNYPVQFFLREACSDIKYSTRRRYRDVRSYVRSWFKPCHPIIRKAIPRQWSDLSELVVDINFAVILQFKEEADAGIVDWEWNEPHKEFKAWLDDAADWIKVRRPALEKEKEAAYPPLGDIEDMFPSQDSTPEEYEKKYGEVNRLEKLIEDTDTKYIKELIERRGYLWT